MPRPTNKEERRAQIANGLISVMAKHGYDGASVAEIARAAGLTQGLVHYHFKNKQEILLFALRNLVELHNTGLAKKLASTSGDPAIQVEVFIDFHLGLGADANPEALACWILLSGEALRQQEIRVEFERSILSLRMQLAEIIQNGVGQQVFECEDIEAAASALVAVIQGYFVLAATARDAIPKGTAAKSTKRMANGLLKQRNSKVGHE